jgi:hypothetical protein
VQLELGLRNNRRQELLSIALLEHASLQVHLVDVFSGFPNIFSDVFVSVVSDVFRFSPRNLFIG